MSVKYIYYIIKDLITIFFFYLSVAKLQLLSYKKQ